MGASVAISSLQFNLESDPTIMQTFPSMSDLQTLIEQIGEARPYANGRIRLVNKAAKPSSIQVSLPVLTRAQINWLKTYVGQLICARDDRENKLYCVYFKVPVVEFSGDIDQGDVTLELHEITHTEAV